MTIISLWLKAENDVEEKLGAMEKIKIVFKVNYEV